MKEDGSLNRPSSHRATQRAGWWGVNLTSGRGRSHRWPTRVLSSLMLVGGACGGSSTRAADQSPTSRASTRNIPHPVTSAPAPTPRPGLRAAFASTSKPFVSPIDPANRPMAVAGDVNGAMPTRDLVGVAPNCLAARDAGPSLGLLMATARDAGVDLHTIQCYRPLSEQVAVRKSWTAAGNSACAARVVTTPSGKLVGTSMHGWGKAADFGDAGVGVKFGSTAYRFLMANAGRFGWNAPAWARQGGSVCPEAWHWEWVGDGGTCADRPSRPTW